MGMTAFRLRERRQAQLRANPPPAASPVVAPEERLARAHTECARLRAENAELRRLLETATAPKAAAATVAVVAQPTPQTESPQEPRRQPQQNKRRG